MNRYTQLCRSNILSIIQQCYMFRLSTSATNR